ncbi:DUF222 domain-containing protein [Nocardioides sp.]|uniref:DUF222 domain-containing protein n=1 Tax=Nocardioides sp. TaxID=35761 RepID=UPI001A1A169A|nr:DUF222 domain-containing protein [Nocardioides sp.]MBJ7356485.1 DUF222 domain-containing protein [Nocardioides sp.]
MSGTAVLDDMGGDDVLAFVGDAAMRERTAQADQLRGAYQWAILHSPERLDPSQEGQGRERARAYGGAGTPEVTEFAAAALGARMGVTTFAAGQLMADALDLHHRCPRLWARVQAGEVKASYARFVVRQTRGLPAEEAAYVDAAVAESADGRIPWTRFEALVEASIVKANPEVAREQEERAARATFAKKLRTEAHGMATFMVRADVATIDQIEAAVTATAGQLTEAMPDASEDERRVHAALLLLGNPGQPHGADIRDLLPTVQLYVHTYTGPDSTGIARLEGHGPVTEAWVRDVLGPTCRFKITPVLDLEGQAPVDAYEIPDRHRQAVHLVTPADTFPYGSSLSRGMDLDHTKPWSPTGPPGQSGLGNYGPMTRSHHRIKTFGGWDVKQPFTGIYLWRDPHGGYYLVDHTGTRQLRSSPNDRPLVVEIYRSLPETRLDWNAA